MIHPEWSSDLKSIFYLLSGHPVKHGISECPFPPICSILSLMGGVIWPIQGFFLSEVRWTLPPKEVVYVLILFLSCFILVKNHMLLKKWIFTYWYSHSTTLNPKKRHQTPRTLTMFVHSDDSDPLLMRVSQSSKVDMSKQEFCRILSRYRCHGLRFGMFALSEVSEVANIFQDTWGYKVL